MRPMLLALVITSAAGCSTESRYYQDPDDVTEYQHVITLTGTAAPGERLVVDFPLAGSDADEAIATASVMWGHTPARAKFYGLELTGRSGLCMLSVVTSSGRAYPLGVAALPGDGSVTHTAQVLPSTPVSTDDMTAEDARDVIASRALIRAGCEPAAQPEPGDISFSLTGGFGAGR